MSALLSAIEAERIFQIKLLLANGGYDLVNKADGNGHTPLIKACLMKTKWKALMVTKLLIQHDADLGLTDKSNRTCLTYACIMGKESLVKVLLDTGDIAPNTRDKFGYTNLMHAVLSGSQSVVTIILVFLNKYGLQLDDRTNNGFTAYMLALKFGYFPVARILQENGASTETFDFVNFKNSEDWGRLSCKKNSDAKGLLHRRSKTAPNRIRKQQQKHPSEDSMLVHNRSSTAYGSMFSSIAEKGAPVEIYHDPYVRSTSLHEASTIFKQRFFSPINPNKQSNSSSKIDFLFSEEDAILVSESKNENASSDTSEKGHSHNGDTPTITMTSKTILGVLLNEGMLTRAQLEQDRVRHEKTMEYKRKMLSKQLLPSIIFTHNVFDENPNSTLFTSKTIPPSRCHSSISNAGSSGGGKKQKQSGIRRMSTSR